MLVRDAEQLKVTRKIVLIERHHTQLDEFKSELSAVTGWPIAHLSSLVNAIDKLQLIGVDVGMILVSIRHENDINHAKELLRVLDCAPDANRTIWPQVLLLWHVRQEPETRAWFEDMGARCLFGHLEPEILAEVAAMKHRIERGSGPLFRIVRFRGVVSQIYLIGPRGQTVFSSGAGMKRFVGGWSRKHHREIPIQTVMDLTELGYESVKVYRNRAAERFDCVKAKVGLAETGDEVFSVRKVDSGYVYELRAHPIFVEADEKVLVPILAVRAVDHRIN